MPKPIVKKCGRCKGKGAIKNIVGFEVTCPVCGGKGWVKIS